MAPDEVELKLTYDVQVTHCGCGCGAVTGQVVSPRLALFTMTMPDGAVFDLSPDDGSDPGDEDDGECDTPILVEG